MKKAAGKGRRLFTCKQRNLHALDLFQHLENALGRLHEKTLESLAQATAFQGVATHAFAFGHDDLQWGGRRARACHCRREKATAKI
ncbi:hypothetical protein [Bordetella genomosp. 6]|uniref:hypothetical protein n=1 Tax=Bordetella genomosp. 6 TaxID=463024 RepID=UPI00142D4D0B|nr:hypothetical protein [Bordetella genomosp. 6]